MSPESIFRWDTMREVGPHVLPYKEPVHGKVLEVELAGGSTVNVFRADDGWMYFCHGLTFGGKEAPGGAVSPFSGKDVLTIVASHYRLVAPESAALAGDILIWRGINRETPHSAILIDAIVRARKSYLEYDSQLLSKNGKLPEATMSLEQLVDGPESYGESYRVYRRN